MAVKNRIFVAWEEHIVSHERGNRIVHYYLKNSSGDLVLAVVGKERSIRHMIYVVSNEFLRIYGPKRTINAYMKWRARRDVVEWLTSLVSKHHLPSTVSNSKTYELEQSLGSREFAMAGFTSIPTHIPDQIQVLRRFKFQHSEIVWSGDSWICCKQLEHYPAFCRKGIIIAVHSFVFIMGEEENYLGYLEDLYEDRKGQKKVKVRWFHHSQEVKGVIPELDPPPREVFITPHVQVISAECIDGPATILTPKHYEKCLPAISRASSSGIFMCFRQFKNNKIKPFSLSKLSGYSNQAILSSLDCTLVSKHKMLGYKSNGDNGNFCITNSGPGNQIVRSEPTYQKLKIKLSRKGPIGIRIVGPGAQHEASFKVDEKIEMLCQDSGISGCWFRCKVLQASPKRLKVQYDDVEDVDGSGNLEEWIPTSRVAAPDKLGMRWSGRITIRPCPPEDDSSDCCLEVGAAVDAWWSDGWWEGVVTGLDVYGSDGLRVYLPGEERFLILQKKHIRSSRDWVDNRWVNIKPNPDVLSLISSKATQF